MTDWTNKTVDELRLLYYGPTCADVAGVDLFDELARRAQANDAMRATLSNWCVQFGAALCPTAGSADSFGDGMRAAKKQVSRILAAAPTPSNKGEPHVEAPGSKAACDPALTTAMLTDPHGATPCSPTIPAPAPSSSGAPAPADPWTPVQCDYDRNIHANPDANAWADFFVQVHPGLADKHDLMRAWFANAMMAMHDSPRCKPAPVDRQREAAIEASPYDALGHAMEILAGTPYTGEMASKVARVLRQWSDKWAAAVDLTCPAPPAPVAPVTEGEVEAAIMDMFAKCKLYGWTDGREYPVAAESEAAVAARDALCALIARRVAEARGAGLREFKAWFAEKATWTIEATAEAPAVRGYSVAPRDIEVQIDRLLAAPPASKLAEEPAQEDDGPCLSALLANMRMEMSDGANGMRTPREEAIAAVVECVARRIEALENNKEAGK